MSIVFDWDQPKRSDRTLRRTVQSIPRDRLPRTGRSAACLAAADLERLALGHSATAPVAQHLESCASCRRNVDAARRAMPHLGLWTLLRFQQGTLSEAEGVAVRHHLHRGGCRECTSRARLLSLARTALDEAVGSFRIPRREAQFAAADPEPLHSVSSNGITLELLTEPDPAGDQDRVLLEARTRRNDYLGRLISYRLTGRSPSRSEEGFMVMRPDVDGWISGTAAFDAQELYFVLGGYCERVSAMPVDLSALGEEDVEVLRHCVSRDRDDRAAMTAWRAWIRVAATNPPAGLQSAILDLNRLVN